MMELCQILARALAVKAKELTEGMHKRVKRGADIADFAAAFDPIIKAHILPDAKSADARGVPVKCEFCDKAASFIIDRCAVCFEHRRLPLDHAIERSRELR